jgi:hypothetical protein
MKQYRDISLVSFSFGVEETAYGPIDASYGKASET